MVHKFADFFVRLAQAWADSLASNPMETLGVTVIVIALILALIMGSKK